MKMTTDPSTRDETPLKLTQAHVEDVLAFIERVRAEAYPTVPAELLSEVLAAEQDNPDSRQVAFRAVGQVVDAYLRTHPDQPAGAPTGDIGSNGGTTA